MTIIRIYGYARKSDGSKQEDSTQRQAESINNRANDLADELKTRAERAGEKEPKVEYMGCVEEEGSATTMRFNERPKLKALLEELQKGDHLIIWRLDRLDRKGTGILIAVEKITGPMGVHLTVLDYGGNEIEMDSMVGMVITHAMAMVAAIDGKQRGEAISAGMRRAYEQHRAVSGRGNFGWRTIIAEGLNGRRVVVKIEPCEKERQQIREIHRRRGRKERWQSIARDFYNRKLLTPQGNTWVKKLTQTQPTKMGMKEYVRWHDNRIKTACWRYDELGEEMFQLDLKPSTKVA